jgi:peptidoglycan/LPS O-acetylase OafA/YrhL
VDVFFVLSGFLITGILLDTRDSPRYFRNFYVRRFLRIFPIYYPMLAVVFFIVPRFMPFDTPGLRMIWRNQLWLWTYLTNIGFVVHRRIWADAGWLDLNHLWSLAVEEQFYLFWPLIVLLCSRRTFKMVCVACLIGSPALRCALWLLHQRIGAIYFPTPCRLDGLALGALVATLVRERGVASLVGAAPKMVFVSLALLLGLSVWRGGLRFNDTPTVVFGPTFAALLAASVLVLSIHSIPGNPVAGVLNNSFLRSAGKYSYAMYLYHEPLQPLLWHLMSGDRIARWVGSQALGYVLFVALFGAVTFAAAFVSWHLYEKHWLKLKRYFEYDRPEPTATAPVAVRSY